MQHAKSSSTCVISIWIDCSNDDGDAVLTIVAVPILSLRVLCLLSAGVHVVGLYPFELPNQHIIRNMSRFNEQRYIASPGDSAYGVEVSLGVFSPKESLERIMYFEPLSRRSKRRRVLPC